MKGQDRKKIIAYLHPELYKQDKKAKYVIDEIPQSLRGEFYRQAVVVGAALSQIDNRLLSLISTFYAGEFSADNLLILIRNVIGDVESLATDNQQKNLTAESDLIEKKIANKLSLLKK